MFKRFGEVLLRHTLSVTVTLTPMGHPAEAALAKAGQRCDSPDAIPYPKELRRIKHLEAGSRDYAKCELTLAELN